MDKIIHQSSQQLPSFNPAHLVLLFVTYLLLVRLVRKRRLQCTLKRFPYITRESFNSMTLEDAFYIQQNIAELEFPFIFQKALQFALFRTYGIPSISKLLVQTTEFSSASTASKRYVDTEVLVAEIYGNHPQQERATEAIARMNFIHSVYRKAGKISDEDMLYTLSLFALEPIRWIERHEWRKLEALERNAIGVFVKALGDAMDISYAGLLKSAADGWKDGIHWLEEIEGWAEEYEEKNMVPHVDNFKTAEHTMSILLWFVPRFAKGLGKNLVITLLDERLRKAIMYERVSESYYTLMSFALCARAFVLQHLSLPRPEILRKHSTSYTATGPDQRYHLNIMETAPYYVKPTLWNRYGPLAWSNRAMGLPLPGDDGNTYFPQGFKVDEVGPRSLSGRGATFAEEAKEKVTKMRMNRCPFIRTSVI